MFDLFWGRGRLDETRLAVTYLFRLLTFVGINPPQRFRPLYFCYSAFYNFTNGIIIPVVFNLGYIAYFKIMTASQVLTAMQPGINVMAMPWKVLAVVVNLRGFRHAEALMTKLDARCDRPSEFAKIRRTAVVGNRYVILVLSLYTAYALVTFVSAIAKGSPPFQLHLPFLNWRESRAEFWAQVTTEFILFMMLICSQVFNDSYPVIYICIIRSHMQILTERVQNLGTQPEKSLDTNYRELVQCILDHKVLLDLHETIGSVISITLFLQFLITAMMLGVTMINMFVFANTSERVACILYIGAISVQIFPCCHQSTWLMEDSEDLALAIFHCNWMDQDVRFRKMLLFFIHRTQKTMTLTALKMLPITLNTSLSIGKFSFSLYTLIKNMDFGQNK